MYFWNTKIIKFLIDALKRRTENQYDEYVEILYGGLSPFELTHEEIKILKFLESVFL